MIKKINYIFTIVLAVLVGTLYFQQFNLNYNQKITFINLNHVLSEENVILELIINPGETGHTSLEFIESALHVIEKLQLPASLSAERLSEDQKHSIRFLFLTNDPYLISHVHLENDQTIEQVMNQPFWQITNNPQIENTVLIDFLDKNYYEFDTGWRNEISFYSIDQIISHFPETTSQIGFRVIVEPQNIALVKQRIANEMSEFFPRDIPNMPIDAFIYKIGKENYQAEHLVPSFLKQMISIPYSILWLSMLCTLFISIYVSIRQTKEIMIGYLHGYDMGTIIKKYFMPYILISGTLFMSVMLGTSYIISDSHSSLFLKYVEELLPFALMYISLMIFSAVLTYVWVKHQFSAEILKENRQFKMIYVAMSILKCGIILTLCIPLLQEWNDVAQRQPYLMVFKQHSKLREGVSVNYSGLNHNIAEDRINLIEDVSKWVAQNKIGYVDFFDYLDNYEIDLSEQENMRNPYFITFNGFTLLKTPYLIVNAKYLYDYVGLIVETTDEVKFLLPQKYGQGSDIYNMIASQSTSEIQYYEQELVFAPHFETSVGIKPSMGVITNPILIVDANAVGKSGRFEGKIVGFSDDEPLYEMINEMEAKYPTTFSVQTIESSYQRINHEQNRSLSIVLQFAFIYVALLIIFVVTTTGVYLSSYANELVVYYMSGYGYFKRYRIIYGVTSIVSVLAFGLVAYLLYHTSALDVEPWLGLLLGTIILDNTVVMSMVHIFESKNMPMIIKGDY